MAKDTTNFERSKNEMCCSFLPGEACNIKGIKVLLLKTSVKWNQILFGRKGADGREKEDDFG